VTLVVATEMHFKIKFRTAELESLRNVGDFARLIRARVTTMNVAESPAR
jgi:acyl carrier protein